MMAGDDANPVDPAEQPTDTAAVAAGARPLIRVPIYAPRNDAFQPLMPSDVSGHHTAAPETPGANRPSGGAAVVGPDATPDAIDSVSPYATDFDTIPDERGIEAALTETKRTRDIGGAKAWMAENLPPEPPKPAAPQEKKPDEVAAVSDAFDVAARRVSDAVISPNKAGDVNAPSALPAIASDVARGAVEAPRQILGGIRDAAHATAELGTWLATNVFGATADDVKDDPALKLPGVKQPKTTTGALVRGVSQFLAGFAGAGKVTGPVNAASKAGQAAIATLKGTLSNFAAFEPHQERLSNLIQNHPALANPVNAYLAAKPEDGEAEGRFKNAIEGLGLGALADGLLRGVRYVRDAGRAAEASREVERGAAAEVAKPPEAKPLELLGDPEAPLITTADARSSALPKELAGAKPRYNFGDKAFELEFARDIEKALFITAQGQKSARDAEYRAWLKALGYSDAEINELGPKVRDAIKEQARTSEAGTLEIGDVAPVPKGPEPKGPTVDTEKLAPVETGVPDATAAKALTEKGMAPLTDGKGAVYVNFARIETPDDVKRLIADTAEAFKGDIDAARRGVRSNARTMEAAGSVDAWEALVARRHGQPMNAEETLAARRLWEASAAKLLDVAEIASTSTKPEDLFQFRKMLAIHKAVTEQVIAARTETARALQSWRIPVGSDGAARLDAIENVLNAYGGSETAQLLAAKVAALKRVPQGLSALDDVARRGALVKTLGAAKEIWINALLSNPQTHVVNIMGNFAGLLNNLLERTVAARYSQLLGSGDVLPGEASALAFGSRAGVREGLRLFVNALRTGQPQFEAQATKATDAGTGYERALSSTYMGMTDDNWMAKAVDGLGTVVNQPVRFLSAEDDFFKAVAYRQEVNAQAFRQATREVQGGQIAPDALNSRIAELAADPPQNIRLEAQKAASYLTYTEKPGHFVEALNRLDRKLAASGSPAGQLGSLAMRVLIPFRNTPANLIKYSFERTPLAPLFAHYREAIKQGGASADIARTRMALGTMTLLGVMDFALDGQITGAGPKEESDKGTRATLMRAGWQPYSIKIGDKYISYKRTDPFGLSLAIAADMAEMINNADLSEDRVEQIWEIMAASTASFGNSVLDKTYMSSMSDFMDVLHNPRKAANFIQKIETSFLVPNVLTIPRRINDPYLRYTHDLTTKLRDRIPGLSSALPVARDMWGRPRSFQSGMGDEYDAISPYYVRSYHPEPIDAAALKNDFNMTMPQWQIGFGAGAINLRHHPEVYSRWLELRGTFKPSDLGDTKQAKLLLAKYGDQAMLPLLNDIVSGKNEKLSGAYDAASDGRNGGKDRMVTKIIGDYQNAAKMKLLDDPVVRRMVDRKQDLSDDAGPKDRRPAAFAGDE